MSENIILSTVDLSMCNDEVDTLTNLGYKLIFDDTNSITWLSNTINAKIYIASASVKFDDINFKKTNNLKILVNPNTGQDHINFDLVNSRNIHFITIKNEYEMLSKISATSELAWGLLLNYIRHISKGIELTKSGRWVREQLMGRQLLGKKVGILGLGRLGSITARIGAGFGCELYYHDPHVVSKKIKKLTLVELFRYSDIIFIHTHLNDNTYHLVNKDLLNKAQNCPIIINTSRANIVNEQAILESINEKKIEAYLTDVIDGEWLSEKEKKSLNIILKSTTSEKVLITPHIGGSTVEGVKLARSYALKMLIKKINENI